MVLHFGATIWCTRNSSCITVWYRRSISPFIWRIKEIILLLGSMRNNSLVNKKWVFSPLNDNVCCCLIVSQQMEKVFFFIPKCLHPPLNKVMCYILEGTWKVYWYAITEEEHVWKKQKDLIKSDWLILWSNSTSFFSTYVPSNRLLPILSSHKMR